MAVFFQPVGFGTTSAHAENTFSPSTSRTPPKNYLRMRGEYPSPIERVRAAPELPPHARRIRCLACRSTLQIGTTSACAENTHHRSWRKPQPRNYLRARGEYFTWSDRLVMRWELPPRARRILGGLCRCLCCRGTTSACAENTRGSLPLPLLPRNYLRVRGEYAPWMRGLLSPRELPPRARRIRDAETGHFATLGTTSACAENTGFHLNFGFTIRNYLRVRGEYDL